MHTGPRWTHKILPCVWYGETKVFRGGLGASRRDEQRTVGDHGRGIGRDGDDDEGDGGGAEGVGGGD